jgi:hypothetical protein
VDQAAVRRSSGAGVLIPGPLKLAQRCREKIAADYGGLEQWPPAASLFDVVRCAIAFEDPYAMACMVAYLATEFDVVRVKNRFENDVVEEVSPERMQAEFYAAETLGESTDSTSESGPKSEKMYRDVLVNLRPKGSDFICEVQLTLTGISILKKSEQKLYSLARMTSAEELIGTFVFSERATARVASKQSLSTASTISAGPNTETLGFDRATIGEPSASDKVESDSSTSFVDLEQGKKLDAAPSRGMFSRGKQVQKPLSGVTTGVVEPTADSDFQRGLFSCAPTCKPCSPELRARETEASETGFQLTLAQAAMIPFDEEKAKHISETLSREYLSRVQDPRDARSVYEARRDLNDFILRALQDDTTDVETKVGLGWALKLFNEKHHDGDASRSPDRSSEQRDEVSNVMSL